MASEPDKFLMPRPSDMRYQWVCHVGITSVFVSPLREGQVSANNLAKGTVSQGLRPQAIIRANASARRRLMRPYPTSRNATGSALT